MNRFSIPLISIFSLFFACNKQENVAIEEGIDPCETVQILGQPTILWETSISTENFIASFTPIKHGDNYLLMSEKLADRVLLLILQQGV